MELLLRSKAEAVDGVGPAVGPLAKLLRSPGEGHAGRHRAVDDGLYGATRTNAIFQCWKQICLTFYVMSRFAVMGWM